MPGRVAQEGDVMQQYSDPPGGKLQIVDQSDSRLVISVPAGGKKARGIGCFAVLWLAITIPLSLVFFMVDDADWEGGEAPPTIFRSVACVERISSN